jgi:UDP-3-O-[3-hydroxymyristoyl] N-acetylglucosamine deacetylase
MKKVLIVDDEKNIQVSLASVLEDEGYQVYFANNGQAGIEKFINVKPDAIFLDIWLPGMDGLEVIKHILAIDPLQIIIMISGHGSVSAAVSALKAGAYDFMEKPLSLDKVIFVLKRGLEYRQVRDENLKLKTILGHEDELAGNDEKKKLLRESTATIEFDSGDTQYFHKQKSVAVSNIIYGIGLHSGEKTGMVIKPLPTGKGIRFENISKSGYIPARIEYLNNTGYATSIKKDELEARTIEHFMAVLHAFQISNLAIKINKEVPIDDGSAINLCEFIKECGIVDQDEIIPDIEITQTLLIGDESTGGKFIKIEPCDVFTVAYTCIYPEPLGRQSYEFVMHSGEDFQREIAPARTYGFVDDFNKLSDMGLAEGGRMNNFILIDKDKIINTTLRFPEELARHKILDIIGDFYLLGRPIRGKITAQKTGHGENAKMVNLIKETFLKVKSL